MTQQHFDRAAFIAGAFRRLTSRNRTLYEIARMSMMTRGIGSFRKPRNVGRRKNQIIGLYHFAQRLVRRFPNLSPRRVGATQGATAKKPSHDPLRGVARLRERRCKPLGSLLF